MNLLKLITKTFNLNTLALFAVIVVYILIVTTLNQGISCDEGFYLMGYQHNQPLGNFISDYANIVRTFTPQSLEGNIMTYRYERLIELLLVLSFFALSLYPWLKIKYSFSLNKVLFVSLVFLTGAMTYTFASPTISYDSIQTFVYLLSFSFLFLAQTANKAILQKVFLLLSGAISVVGVLNYFPSGVFLIAILCVWIFLENSKLKNLLFYFIGIIVGAVIYHFIVRDLIEYSAVAFDTIIKVFTEKSASRHDSGGLIKSFVIKFGLFLIYLPIVYLFSVLFKKLKVSSYVIFSLIAVATLFLLIFRNVYSVYAPVFFLPIALISGKLIAENTIEKGKKINIKDLIIIVSLIVLPFLGVFGTNQNLYAKMLIFIPFWLVALFIIISKVQSNQTKQIALFLTTVLLFAGYVYLGNFSRYHYYYTPRSSRYPIENIERSQRVLVSKFQQDYYRELADTLKIYGAKSGDRYLAFGENQMAVYLMGGYVAGKLPYHWFQYKEFPSERPKFFILFKNEEQEVIELLKTTKWDFPKAYHRMEMRAISENMDQEELKTVVYALESVQSTETVGQIVYQ